MEVTYYSGGYKLKVNIKALFDEEECSEYSIKGITIIHPLISSEIVLNNSQKKYHDLANGLYLDNRFKMVIERQHKEEMVYE